ncbi:MAG: TRAP-type C4-dicarboxylate transport system, small permease component [Deltaproteobacteria bacterium]|jgi:TRAP-type C4-dicarboxylate transport system permease small subunit|nr:TRAP-type C4-dicarboxylate transport system, small permease component [Deltaproteobacteria bacterium]
MESKLDSFLKIVNKILNIIGGTALTVMMFLTVSDVIMRTFGYPILGAYEMVAMLLAVVIGFTIPKVSLDKGHVIMEFVLEKLSPKGKAVMITFTRILCIALFAIIGYNLFLIAKEFNMSGEVSSTLKIPFFPIAYCVGVCCFVECLVLVSDIAVVWRESK